MFLAPGTRVDRYEVVGELGRGGLGVVYQATHRYLATRHALKVIDGTDPLHRARGLREARLQSGLHHPAIVAATDLLEHGELLIIVLDLVSGPTLSTWMTQPALNHRLRFKLLSRLVKGVAHAHRRGVIHRDLKPGNVLVDESVTPPQPRIIDFGAARCLLGPDSTTLTDPGTVIGTPLFMAPEQLAGRLEVSPAVDVFSLGCILFEALFKVRPFQGQEPAELLRARRAEEWLDPRSLRTDMPEHIHLAVLGCLRSDPLRRIPDAMVLARILSGREDPRPWAPPRRMGRVDLGLLHRGPDSQWTEPGPTATLPGSREPSSV